MKRHSYNMICDLLTVTRLKMFTHTCLTQSDLHDRSLVYLAHPFSTPQFGFSSAIAQVAMALPNPSRLTVALYIAPPWFCRVRGFVQHVGTF